MQEQVFEADRREIAELYEKMYRAMVGKDTASLGRLLSDDSVLIHMTGHRQPKSEYLAEIASGVLNYYSVDTESLTITINGDTAHMIGRSQVNAAVYGCGRHTWRLQTDSQLRKVNGVWKITLSKASTY